MGLEGSNGDPLYGKRYALDMMQIEKRYRSFDLNGWHFIVLDSTHLKADGSWYTAKLDQEQFDWLKNDLAATNPSMPVLILSHIPILAGCVFMMEITARVGTGAFPDRGCILIQLRLFRFLASMQM